MWDKITQIAVAASSMLQTGKYPIGTPDKYKEEMGKVNFLTSKKFFVVFCSVIIISVYFGIGTAVLFLTAPFPLLTPAFVTMFVEVLKVFVIVIGSFLALQTTIDYKMSSNTNIEQTNETLNQNITETLEEKHTYIEESRSRPEYEEE